VIRNVVQRCAALSTGLKEPPHSSSESGTGPKSVQRFCAWVGLPSVIEIRAAHAVLGVGQAQGLAPARTLRVQIHRFALTCAGDKPHQPGMPLVVPCAIAQESPHHAAREVAHATPPARCRRCVARTLSLLRLWARAPQAGAGNERGVLGLFSCKGRTRPALRSALKCR